MSEGGAQRVISVLSDQFCKNGHDVRILVTNGNEELCYQLNGSVRLLKPESWAQPKNGAARFWEKAVYKIKYVLLKNKRAELKEKRYYSQKAAPIADYLKRESADIVYSFLAEPNIMIGLAAKDINAKIIMAERNYPNKPYYSEYFKELRDKCYEKADICVFQTEEQKKFFPEKVQKKSVVIPNPVKEGLPCAYEGERKKIIVNYCGFRTQKNIPVLIAAFGKIADKHREYKLEIYGSGDLKDELQKSIDRLGLSDRIALLPFDADIHRKIVDYSMFVMTSDYEGMPNSLLEAMAIGLPVISTDCDGGGARALIEDGVSGLLVPKGDADAVASAMEDLIDHPEKAESLSKNAQKIKNDLSVEKIAERWLELAK